MSSKPILAVAFAIGAWSVPAAAQPPPTAKQAELLPALATRVDRLQAHIESIESVRAIKRLQYAYGHYVELGLWNDFADLFTEDAITNYQQGAHGKAEVRKLFLEQVGQGRLGLSAGRIYPPHPVSAGDHPRAGWPLREGAMAHPGDVGRLRRVGHLVQRRLRERVCFRRRRLEDQRTSLGTQGHGGVRCCWLERFRNARPVSLRCGERHWTDPGCVVS